MGRRLESPPPADDALRREAEMLARKARTRLRGTVPNVPGSPHLAVAERRDRALAEIDELADPVDRLRAYIELGEELAPALPAGCSEHALPVGDWWHGRLAELEGLT
jgi:hypothetical protein